MNPITLTSALLLTGLLAGCGHFDENHAPDASDAPHPGRGRVAAGKADHLEGRCHDAARLMCGGPSDGSCWCDELCVHYGDCCADKSDACDLPGVLRMADVLTPGPRSFPVFLDLPGPELIGAPLRLELSRPEMVSSLSYTSPFKLFASYDGRLLGINPSQSLRPCWGDDPELCTGPLEVSLWSDNEPSVLIAQKTVELAPGDGDPTSPAGCMGVGNVANFSFLAGYLGSIGAGTMANILGTWRASRNQQTFEGVPSWRILVSTSVENLSSSLSFDAAVPRAAALGERIPINSLPGSGSAWMHYQGACGQGELVVYEMEQGEATSETGGWLSRLTMGWELRCHSYLGGEKRETKLTGCIHYDADNPVLNWDPQAPW